MRRFLVCVTELKVGIYRLSEDFPILETTRDTGTILFFSIHTNDTPKEIQTKIESVSIVNPITQNGIGSYSLSMKFLEGVKIDGNDLYFTQEPISFKSEASRKFNIHIVKD